MELIFWICAAVLAYIYIGYAFLVRLLAGWIGVSVSKAQIEPSVTVIVTAYNEEKGIQQKLRNLLALDYPREKVEILVASDASSDATDQMVKEFPSTGVSLLRIEGRQGKTACQNQAARRAQGEILVFTDATTMLDRNCLKAFVENFADKSVGCVAGALVYEKIDAGSTAEGGVAYWDYEMKLRRSEGRLTSLVGVSGCLYAVRKNAYREIRPDLISDFVIALQTREGGLRTVLEPKATCTEDTLSKGGQELAMRVRVAVRSMHAIIVCRRMLNPLKYGLFSWQMWSHKVLRYASPVFCIGAFVSCAALLPAPMYVGLFVAQCALIAAGAIGAASPGRFGAFPVISQCYYFLLTNLASILAAARYLKGERMVTWRPIR